MTVTDIPNHRRLDEKQVKVLSIIDQLFWETGYAPTHETISERLGFGIDYIKKCYKNETFRQALIVRGVDLNPEASKLALQPKQVMLANLLLNAHDRRSVREKLEQVEVSSQQYNAWLRQPAFSDYLRKRAEAVFKSADWEAYQSVVDGVRSKDLNATKFFFELRGLYSPRVQIDVNVETVIVQVVEVIQRHVKDPHVLTAIANDIEKIINPKRQELKEQENNGFQGRYQQEIGPAEEQSEEIADAEIIGLPADFNPAPRNESDF